MNCKKKKNKTKICGQLKKKLRFGDLMRRMKCVNWDGEDSGKKSGENSRGNLRAVLNMSSLRCLIMLPSEDVK